jgi:spermidine synthase
MLGDDEEWFTEICRECGTAFSLRSPEKLHDEQTPYQHLEVYQTEKFGKLMVLDGFIMLTQRDNFLYHEMMVHPALFTHPDPRHVVIVGGGDCGTLREVLRHPSVQTAHQVEIDERVTRISERYFPELCESNDDPRAELVFEDAVAWIQNAEPGSLDVIIVDSTDPIGPAEGLFAEPFFRECHRALGPEGILVQQSESPLLHWESIIKPMQGGMRAAGFEQLDLFHFPQPVYPSGWWSATMALKNAQRCHFREQDARAKPFATRYYNADIHQAAKVQPEFLKGSDQGESPL